MSLTHTTLQALIVATYSPITLIPGIFRHFMVPSIRDVGRDVRHARASHPMATKGIVFIAILVPYS